MDANEYNSPVVAASSQNSSAGTGSTYVIITPVRDEETFLKFTIESVVSQTIRPKEWVIVNDGSTDNTGNLIDSAAGQHPWIRAVHRKDRGFRKSGGGVIEAFDDGYSALTCQDWEFLVKLDGDLSFEPEYFARALRSFKDQPSLGIGGGVIYHMCNGRRRIESCPAFHVRGATKIYRRACWRALGGLWPAPGWDTIDEVKANMLGWATRSFGNLGLTHHRLTGSADGRWGGMVKNGRADYVCGYHPIYVLAKCLYRLFSRPYVLGSLATLYGFLAAYAKRIPQVNDLELIQYLRREQLSRLWGGKTIWR